MTANIRARRSQLITTYGVGSLYPAERSSFIVQGTHTWPEDALSPIFEPRLARRLGVQGFNSPPATPADRAHPSISVALFPKVFACPHCGAVGTLRQLSANASSSQCGICDKKPSLTPSRFVITCEDGHLDDFPFYYWCHRQFPNADWRSTPYTSSEHRLSITSSGHTSSLAGITISCSCGKSETMNGAFDKNALKKIRCGGSRLWLGTDQFESCDLTPRALQRGASNVWFGVTDSAISIPPYSTRLNQVLARELKGFSRLSLSELTPPLGDTALGAINHVRLTHGLDQSQDEIASALRALLHPSEDTPSAEGFRFEEYQAIIRGAATGNGAQFESEKVEPPLAHADWITEVRQLSRLRVVSALRGFTRLTSSESFGTSDRAMCPLSPEPLPWLPASELLGEGLFIGLEPQKVNEWAVSPFARRRASILSTNRRMAALARDIDLASVGPVSAAEVALHSLAHMVMDQLALDAGYPASSLKERLYVGENMAGFLVYTATSGSAGSLGGVQQMALPDRLGPALDEALSRFEWCSADPVCSESEGSGTDASSLAACHNCLFLPETCCELFNTQLDRLTIFGARDLQHQGVIDWLKKDMGPNPLHEMQRRIVDLGYSAPEVAPDVTVHGQTWSPALGWPAYGIYIDWEPDTDRDDQFIDRGWTMAISRDGSGMDVLPQVLSALRAAGDRRR